MGRHARECAARIFGRWEVTDLKDKREYWRCDTKESIELGLRCDNGCIESDLAESQGDHTQRAPANPRECPHRPSQSWREKGLSRKEPRPCTSQSNGPTI